MDAEHARRVAVRNQLDLRPLALARQADVDDAR